MTTTGQGARRRQARITGPAERSAPDTSLDVPSTSMSAPAERSRRTRAARPSAFSTWTSTSGAWSAWTERTKSSMSMETSSAVGCAGTA
jgi:hypothetical protein